MSEIAKKLRVVIIDKLKEYDSYIDNELPDYIMVMIANKKSSNQMKEDLSLFIGDNVGEFVDWLDSCLAQIKLGKDPFVAKEESKLIKSTPINKINNEIEEDTKKSKPVRKEITFNKNEFTNKNDDDKPKQLNQQQQLSQPKKESSNQQNLIKSDEQNKRLSHKRIIYNLDNANQNNNSPPKRLKNQINYTQQTNRTTNIHSRLTIPQSSSSTINSNENRKLLSNNQIRLTKTTSTSITIQNRSVEISSFKNNHKYQQTNSNDSKKQEIIADDKVTINQLPNKKKQNSMIFKAIEAANKSSNLESVNLRKTETSNQSQKKSLINRLGIASKIDNDIKDIEPKKENRIVDSKFINQHLNKLSLNSNRNQQNSNNQTIKTRLKQQNNEKDNQLIEPQQNLKSDDLRHRLSSKRKNDNEQINLIKRKVLNNQNQRDENIEDDEELKKLRNNIKPKVLLINDHLKSNNSNDNNEQKKDNVDSDENINLIKRQLLEKVKYYEEKLKLANKDNKEATNQIKKERCMYWPLCNLKEKCQYHHPNTICLQFPSCKWGATCLNIHPKCKFDKLCTKQNCPYTHTFGRFSKLATTATFYKIPATIQKITPN